MEAEVPARNPLVETGKMVVVEALLDKEGQRGEWLEGSASLQGMLETEIPTGGRSEIKVSEGPFNPEVLFHGQLWVWQH